MSIKNFDEKERALNRLVEVYESLDEIINRLQFVDEPIANDLKRLYKLLRSIRKDYEFLNSNSNFQKAVGNLGVIIADMKNMDTHLPDRLYDNVQRNLMAVIF